MGSTRSDLAVVCPHGVRMMLSAPRGAASDVILINVARLDVNDTVMVSLIGRALLVTRLNLESYLVSSPQSSRLLIPTIRKLVAECVESKQNMHFLR